MSRSVLLTLMRSFFYTLALCILQVIKLICVTDYYWYTDYKTVTLSSLYPPTELRKYRSIL